MRYIVVYKDGTWKRVDVAWEFESDPDWFVTIDLEDSGEEPSLGFGPFK